jgi:hypothetical protein
MLGDAPGADLQNIRAGSGKPRTEHVANYKNAGGQ